MRRERMRELRRLRLEQALSLHTLAERAGLSLSQVARLESGTSTAWPQTAGKLAAALRCTVDDLYGGEMADPAPSAPPRSGAAASHSSTEIREHIDD